MVFIVGCDDGLLPLRSWRGAEVDYAEERRLLFVGMTRATTRLTLFTAAKRTLRGEVAECAPSPFLSSIEPSLLDRRGGDRGPRPARRQGRSPPAVRGQPAGHVVLSYRLRPRYFACGEVVDRDAADGLRLEVGGHPGGDRRRAAAAAEAVAALARRSSGSRPWRRAPRTAARVGDGSVPLKPPIASTASPPVASSIGAADWVPSVAAIHLYCDASCSSSLISALLTWVLPDRPPIPPPAPARAADAGPGRRSAGPAAGSAAGSGAAARAGTRAAGESPGPARAAPFAPLALAAGGVARSRCRCLRLFRCPCPCRFRCLCGRMGRPSRCARRHLDRRPPAARAAERPGHRRPGARDRAGVRGVRRVERVGERPAEAGDERERERREGEHRRGPRAAAPPGRAAGRAGTTNTAAAPSSPASRTVHRSHGSHVGVRSSSTYAQTPVPSTPAAATARPATDGPTAAATWRRRRRARRSPARAPPCSTGG